jgi:hypothetical protein
MRKNKTSRKNRATFKYYDAYERCVVEIVPGKDGVTEALIEQLHQMDDEEFDSNRSFVRFAER